MNFFTRMLDTWRQRFNRDYMLARIARFVGIKNTQNNPVSHIPSHAFRDENQVLDSNMITPDHTAPPSGIKDTRHDDQTKPLPLSTATEDNDYGSTMAESPNSPTGEDSVAAPQDLVEKTTTRNVHPSHRQASRSEFRRENAFAQANSALQSAELAASIRQLNERVSQHTQSHVTREELKRELESLRRLMENKK